ncbi:MAG: hypothetical protein GY835_05330 [bacterium]|nr:hypothetical protein [bacterium]
MSTWRLQSDGPLDGENNMRLDGELFAACEESELNRGGSGEPPLPVLRTYTWDPWTVSLGQGQQPDMALDLAELRRRGYGWVRRPTGGRAVFHADEITYAVIAPLRGPFAGSLSETHSRIAHALQRFYRYLGLETELSRPAPAVELSPRIKAPCFVAPGLAELEVDGRKIAGSAQRRGRRAFLQHGSLPIGPAHLELIDLLPFAEGDSDARARMRRVLARRSTCLRDLLPEIPSVGELQILLAQAFAEEFALRWEPPDNVEGGADAR